MISLMDMQPSESYLGFAGGLYENSSNAVPADHDAVGRARAAQVQPLDGNGNSSASGRIVFESIGMSNAQSEFGAFVMTALSDARVNHKTQVMANGALGGITACPWTVALGPPNACGSGTENQYDRVRDTVLAPLGVTEKQVQALWIKEANADPKGSGFRSLCDSAVAGCVNDLQAEAIRYESQLGQIIRAARSRYPSLEQIFLASRIYAGYATSTLNPEPYAYEYGFSVKWLIQAQINQRRNGSVDPVAGNLNDNDGTAGWAAWGPYFWANDNHARSDGLVWVQSDFGSDGTHPSGSGVQKVVTLLMNFFLNSPYTPWFRAS